MGKHKLEEYFKDRLGQHEEFIDKNELWANLGLEEEPRKKRPLWFWFFGVGLVLMTAGLGTYAVVDRADIIGTSGALAQDKITALPVEKSLAAESIIDKSSDRSIAPVSTMSYSTEDTISNLAQINTVSNQSSDNLQSRSKNSGIKFKQETKSTIIQASEIKENNQQLVAASIERDRSESEVKISVSIDSEKIAEKGIMADNTGTIKAAEKNFIPLISKLAILDAAQLEPEKSLFSFSNNNLVEPRIADRSLWSAGAYSILYITERTLQSIDTEQESYINNRDEFETQLETFVVGGFLHRQLTDKFYVKAGLEYQAITERFDYSKFRDTTTVSNAVEYDVTILQEWKNYNRHKLFNVPLTLGYSDDFGRWGFIAEVTPIFTIRKSFDGLLLETDGSLSSNTDQFGTEFSMGGRLAIGLAYNCNEKFSIYFLPSYQMHFGSFTKATIGYEQRYSMLGVHAGVRYGF